MAVALLVDGEPSVFESAFASRLRELSAPVVEIAAVMPVTGASDTPPPPRGETLAADAPRRPSVTAPVDGTCGAEVSDEDPPMGTDPGGPEVVAPVVNGAAVITTVEAGPASPVSTPEQAAFASTDAGPADPTSFPSCDSPGSAFGPDKGRLPCAGRVTSPPFPDARATDGDPVAELEAMLAAAAALSGMAWHDVGGGRLHEALDVLEQLDRHLAGVRAGVLSTIEAEGLWALDGQRTFTSWLKQRTDTTPAAASRQVRHARALRDHLPLTRGALDAGKVSTEHVGILVREALLTERLRAQLADADLGEAFLVEQAKELDAATFAKLVKHWAIASDPEAADRAWREAGTKEEFTLSRTLDGYHLNGWLDEVSGQVLDTALRSHMGRKSKDDERTPAQRRAAAIVSLAHQSLDTGLQGAHSRIRPHLTVTVSWETMRTLAAATGSPVPPCRSDGSPHEPGAAFGFWADTALTALGGPRDPDHSGQQDLFELSDEARAWMQTWQPGDTHVISTAIDPKAMTGVEPATLADGTPIPPALLSRLACDSDLSRVIFGPHSTILDVGREQRIFPAHMVRAIHARDKTCRYPGCDEPPGFGEIHHSLQWYRDHGPTSVETGILLCWHHHDWVHAHKITIVRANGQWCFYDRNGWLITARDDDEPPPDD